MISMEKTVKFQLTLCSALTLGVLAGCAGVTDDIAVNGTLPAQAHQAVKYSFAHTPAQTESGAKLPYEALLRDGLATRGFVEGKPDAAQYLVSVAWASRPVNVTAQAQGECDGPGGCPSKGASGFGWFGPKWTHTMTLRFFALPAGTEAYRVTVVKRDRNADAQAALPYLVTGALAQLPYAGAPQWRVSLREPARPGALPEVKSVKPVVQQ